MSIKEFLQDGGKISTTWKFISDCTDEFTAKDADDEIEDCDELTQMSNDQDRYAEDQYYDPKSEYFDIYDKNGQLLAQHVDNDAATSFIKQLKHA